MHRFSRFESSDLQSLALSSSPYGTSSDRIGSSPSGAARLGPRALMLPSAHEGGKAAWLCSRAGATVPVGFRYNQPLLCRENKKYSRPLSITKRPFPSASRNSRNAPCGPPPPQRPN
jgi:hypothetical protein